MSTAEARFTKVRFNSKAAADKEVADFVPEVHRRVAEYFETMGRSQKADWRIVLKTVALLGGTHDALHRAYSSNKQVNQFLGYAILGARS